MRKIIYGRNVVTDGWRYAGEPGTGPGVLPLAVQLAAHQAGTLPAGAGVSIAPEDEIDTLAPLLPRLALIVIDFPKLGEGRGYTQARLLRQRLRYQGELRARGALNRDQLYLLARCGFDSFDLEPRENLQAAIAALGDFTVAYQPGVDAAGLALPRRRA